MCQVKCSQGQTSATRSIEGGYYSTGNVRPDDRGHRNHKKGLNNQTIAARAIYVQMTGVIEIIELGPTEPIIVPKGK